MTWPSATAYSLARRFPSASKMPMSRSSLWSAGYFSETPSVIEWSIAQPFGAFSTTSVRSHPPCGSHTGAGGPSRSGLPGPTLPSYDADDGAAPPTPTVGLPAAVALTAVKAPAARKHVRDAAVQRRKGLGMPEIPSLGRVV
jgi:hypothetical protein